MPRLLPLVLSVALFMENMDATVIATSLPAIAADIGSTPVELKLALTAYFVALAIFIPVSAWLGDRLGVKRVFSLAILVFIAGSLACAAADSLLEFVLARFFQGMGGAMMTPLARLLLFRVTPRGDLVRATALLTIPAVVAPLVGPPVGGFLTTYLSWHWIFLINAPIGLAGLVLIARYLPEVESAPTARIDLAGFALLAVAFSGLVFGLSLLSLPVLPTWFALGCAGTGLAAGLVYLRHARHTAAPILDPRILSEPSFRAATFGTAIFLVGVGAIPFLMPLMFQIGFGMTPFESGLVTFTGAVGALTAKFLAPRLYAAAGFRTSMIAAALLSAICVALKGTFAPETPIALIIAILFFGGILRSFFFTGHHVLSVSDIRYEDAGPAMAISTVSRPIATALSVALVGGVLEASARDHGVFTLADFHVAFFCLAAVSAVAALPFLRLAPDAGSAASGHARS